MKKLFAIILSVAMLATMSVTAFAAEGTIDALNRSRDIDINATYIPGSDAQTVYKVDVAWGSMEFTYTDEYKGVWDPETHTYSGSIPAGWTAKDETANKITVTNHSNAEIYVEFSCLMRINGLTAAFGGISSQGNIVMNLPSAEGTAADQAPEATVEMTLSGGALSEGQKNVNLGTVTVALIDAPSNP